MTLITNNAVVSGPNVAAGTLIIGGTCGANTVQLNQNATATGTATHVFTMPGYALPFPPQNAGVPATLNCSVSPALFTAPICAGQYFTYYMCTGNVYTFSLCSAALWNSTITITNTTGTALATGTGTYDDDGCGTTNGHATLTFIPTVSNTYRVRIFEYPCLVNASLCGTIQVSANPAPAAPANDDPTGAMALTVGSGCTTVSATTDFATQSTGVGIPTACGAPPCSAGTAGFAGYDVWFSLNVPASGNVVLETGLNTASNIAMAVYSGTPGSLTQLGGPTYCGSCNDDEIPGVLAPFLYLTGLTPGATLYARIWPNGGLPSSGTFTICAVDPVPPANDAPCNGIAAPALVVCTPIPLTTDYATGLDAGMTLVPATPTCGALPNNDVWAIVTMPSSGMMTLTLQAQDLTDMAFAAYSLTGGTACAGTLTQVGCASDAGGDPMPELILTGVPGTEYYVRMWSETAVYGSFSLCVVQSLPPPAPVSDCGGAMLVCGDEIITLAPGDFGLTQDLDVSNHGCLQTNERQGAWFRFTTNATGTIAFDINIGVGTDYDFGVWGPFDGTVPCPPQGPPIRCNWSAIAGPTGLNYTATNPSNGAGGPSFSSYIDALPNETYVLYVDNFTMNGLSFDLIWDNQPSDLIACITTSVVEGAMPQLELHPNPASDQLMTTSPFSEGTVQVEVMDASGRLVLRKSVASGGPITLDIDQLVPGLHLLRMTDRRGRVATARFMKE